MGNVNYGLSHYYLRPTVVLPDGMVYFIGGHNSSKATLEVQKFNPITHTTSVAPSLSLPRYWFAATVVGTKIVTCGGSLSTM
jgi:hypothetical protein